MSNYLKIISNWGSKAQEGRNMAKREEDMRLKTAQLQHQNRLLEEDTQRTMEQRMNNFHQQGEELAKHYRPQDLERMKTVAAEAQNDQARLALDQQKAENAAQLGAARIQSQEGIVQARINAAREREMMKQQG